MKEFQLIFFYILVKLIFFYILVKVLRDGTSTKYVEF